MTDRHAPIDSPELVTLATRMAELIARDASERVEQAIEARVEELRRPDQGLTRAEVLEKVGVSAASWSKLRAAGLVPAPLPGTNRYSERAVEEWMAGRWQPAARKRGGEMRRTEFQIDKEKANDQKP